MYFPVAAKADNAALEFFGPTDCTPSIRHFFVNKCPFSILRLVWARFRDQDAVDISQNESGNAAYGFPRSHGIAYLRRNRSFFRGLGNMSGLDALDGLAFETDRNGIIKAIGANNWDAFAMDNGAPELTSDAVIGRDLFGFIEGKQVRDQIGQILDWVSRYPNWAWVLPFRCDSPKCLRNILQSLRPIHSDGVCIGFVFHSFHQSSWPRPPMGLYDFKRHRELSTQEPNLPVVMMCSWCQRVQFFPIGGADWMSGEEYYSKGGRSEVQVSHGMCEECLETKLDPLPIDEGRYEDQKR